MEDYTKKAIDNYNNPPIAYMYDEKGIFTQTEICSLDPLESKIKGEAVWLIPANATLIKPPASIEKHVRVFKNGVWAQVEDTRGIKYWLPGDTWQTEPHEMKDLGPLPNGALLERPEKSLKELKIDKLSQIDTETSAAIISGFDYIINNTKYHFSYDSFDQQNFVDTASMCQLALSGAEGLPTSVTWNSYLEDGTLVQQEFDANSFLKLYTSGAIAHKATQMAIGGQRKAAVQLAKTKEELDNI